MTLRIVAEKLPKGMTLKLSGRLMGRWVDELGRSFELIFETGMAIVIDISDVTFVGSDGVTVLRDLIARGAALRGCPAYLAAQLEGAAS